MPLKIGDDLVLYDVAELAKLFKVTPLTVKAYIRAAKLRGRKMGKKWYVSETSLSEFFDCSQRMKLKYKHPQQIQNGLASTFSNSHLSQGRANPSAIQALLETLKSAAEQLKKSMDELYDQMFISATDDWEIPTVQKKMLLKKSRKTEPNNPADSQ